MNISRVVADEVAAIDPISYSIVFDSREYKEKWHVEFTGDRQAILSTDDGKSIEFKTRQEAERYCLAMWPELHRIDSNRT